MRGLLLALFALVLTLSAGMSAPSVARDAPVAVAAAGLQHGRDAPCHRGSGHDAGQVCSCCAAVAGLVSPAPEAVARRRGEVSGLGLASDTWRDGVDIAPVTGPPELSA